MTAIVNSTVCKCAWCCHVTQHPGKGLDVRRRKIWDMYGSQTVLEVSGFEWMD